MSIYTPVIFEKTVLLEFKLTFIPSGINIKLRLIDNKIIISCSFNAFIITIMLMSAFNVLYYDNQRS